MSRVVLRPVFVFSAMCARRLWRPMAIVRRPPTTTIDGRRQRRAHTTKPPMKGATDSQHVVGEDVSGVAPSACGHSSWRQPIAACGGKQYVSGVACLPYARTQHVHTTSSSSLTGAQCWPPGRAARIRSVLRVRPLPRGNPAQYMLLVPQLPEERLRVQWCPDISAYGRTSFAVFESEGCGGCRSACTIKLHVD